VIRGRTIAGSALGGVARAASGAEVTVFAAGSLRAPFTDLAQEFERVSGHKIVLTFGGSGLLRDRINSGERADIFVSANMEHPQSLASLGWAGRVERFARNRMCLLTAPNVTATTESVLDTMLDPSIKLGTSTPKADPSGDYAWEVFRKAETLRPGAFAVLSAKALQLTGGPQSAAPPAVGNVYGILISKGEANVFLTYRTNAELARKEQPQMRVVKLPQSLEVVSDYGMALRSDAASPGREFAAYLRWTESLRLLAAYGFDPP
jgi:molybdate transport system substrate-binding protein